MNKIMSWKTWKGWKVFLQINSKKIFCFIKSKFQNDLFLAGTLPSRPTDNLIHNFLECLKSYSSKCSTFRLIQFF